MKRSLPLAAVLLAALSFVGCEADEPSPVGPSNTNTTQIVNVNINPQPSPSPGTGLPSGCPTVAKTGVSLLGTGGADTSISVGEEAPLDTTPVDANNIPVPFACASAYTVSWQSLTPPVCTIQGDSSSYTPRLLGVSPGACQVRVVVASVSAVGAFTVVP